MYAFKGAVYLLKKESSIRVQFTIALSLTLLGFYFNISRTEWMVQLLCISMVMGIEGLNTALEEMANFIHPEKNNKIGLIKDIAAGSVFIVSVFSIIIGLIIYIPKFF
ncbi:MAG: diacylglycerol kinase family protein [Flavobacteriales bacterium]|nr:diacylglycerol kinase family protein [Flavobacteriales bacterium]